jgi:hypothetical protein
MYMQKHKKIHFPPNISEDLKKILSKIFVYDFKARPTVRHLLKTDYLMSAIEDEKTYFKSMENISRLSNSISSAYDSISSYRNKDNSKISLNIPKPTPKLSSYSMQS